MILGVLSDSHGHVERTRAAIEILEAAGATKFVHCGDVGSEDVLSELIGKEAWFVLGNCDEPARDLLWYAQTIGLHTPGPAPLELELAGRRIAVAHGHERAFERLLAQLEDPVGPRDQAPDYILHGHTHVARDVRIGRTRVINPGALVRARHYSVATLDLLKDEARFWPV